MLDAETELPVLASLLGTTNKWSCSWIGIKLKQIGKIPSAIITDGLQGYNILSSIFAKAYPMPFSSSAGSDKVVKEAIQRRQGY